MRRHCCAVDGENHPIPLTIACDRFLPCTTCFCAVTSPITQLARRTIKRWQRKGIPGVRPPGLRRTRREDKKAAGNGTRCTAHQLPCDRLTLVLCQITTMFVFHLPLLCLSFSLCCIYLSQSVSFLLPRPLSRSLFSVMHVYCVRWADDQILGKGGVFPESYLTEYSQPDSFFTACEMRVL